MAALTTAGRGRQASGGNGAGSTQGPRQLQEPRTGTRPARRPLRAPQAPAQSRGAPAGTWGCPGLFFDKKQSEVARDPTREPLPSAPDSAPSRPPACVCTGSPPFRPAGDAAAPLLTPGRSRRCRRSTAGRPDGGTGRGGGALSPGAPREAGDGPEPGQGSCAALVVASGSRSRWRECGPRGAQSPGLRHRGRPIPVRSGAQLRPRTGREVRGLSLRKNAPMICEG